MFDLEFVLYPNEDEQYRACYISDELKIQFIMPYITDGYHDLIKCINHEYMHALIDWALDGTTINKFKQCWDPSGESDHFIMRLINFD
jgi:hypothetical protein